MKFAEIQTSTPVGGLIVLCIAWDIGEQVNEKLATKLFCMSIRILKSNTMASWVEYSVDTEFPIQNLPYGIFHLKSESAAAARAGVAIGEWILDLSVIQKAGLFPGKVGHSDCFSKVILVE